MYHHKFNEADAVPLDAIEMDRDLVAAEPDLAARAMAILMIAALPFLLLAFLVRFVWSDVKALGRGLRGAYRVYAEAFAQKP